MERVFISFVVSRRMAAIRQAVRAAVDSLDMRPVMFETEPARDEASRRALLDEVANPTRSSCLLALSTASRSRAA